jgi:L-lactate utilization protein LutC
LCGACKEACPVDIDLPKLLTRVRAGESPSPIGRGARGEGKSGLSSLSSLFLWMYSRVARSPRLFAVSQRFAWVGTRLLSPFSDYVHLPAFTGWGYSKDLPRFAVKPFRERFRDMQGESDPEIQVNTYTSRQINFSEDNTEQTLRNKNRFVDQFIQELTKVSGSIVRTNSNELTNKVIDFLQAHEINRIHLEPKVLDESILEKAGLTVSNMPDAALRVGVTKAICGLADTGSILIADGEGNPLQASLLPVIHLAVLCISNILPSLADALALPIVRESSSAVVITGPSRTGDIEMSLTIGVHGPSEVHVFLVDD